MRNPQLDALVLRKYRHLLDDDWVRRWYYDKCRKSIRTGTSYMKTLGRVMNALGLTPSGFIALEQDDREGRLIDYLDWLSENGGKDETGCADGYVETTESIIKAWMAWRRVPMTRKTNRIRNPHKDRNAKTPIPTRENARTYMRSAPLRAKFLASCTMYSAMRYAVLSYQERREGLRFKDLPEVRIMGKEVVFDAIPTLVKVPWYLSKNGKPYPTFWCRETCLYFKALTEQRLRDGEIITPDSLVFPPVGHDCTTGYLGDLQLHAIVREAMNDAGLTNIKPYTWKSYCLDGLQLSEREEQGLRKEDRMLIVGHECGVHYDYIYGKQDLAPETKERLRRAYEYTATKYLEAFPEVKDLDSRLFQSATLLKLLGYTDQELASMDLSGKTETELLDLARNAVPRMTIEKSSKPATMSRPLRKASRASVASTASVVADSRPGGAKPRQRLVEWTELDALLEQGWIYVREFPDGRILVAGP